MTLVFRFTRIFETIGISGVDEKEQLAETVGPQDSKPDMRTSRRRKSRAPPLNAMIQLPLWPDPDRGIPNSILRSALFGLVRRGRRRFVDKEPIASWPGITIRYTGVTLDQSDLDVWLLSVHLARHHMLGSQIRFSAYGFLQGIGRSQGKQNREWLKAVFTRLTASAVEISVGNRSYTGSLVNEFFHDKGAKEYVLTVNPRLAMLFDDGYSLLAWRTRNALRTELAKWIHCFVCSHVSQEHLAFLQDHRRARPVRGLGGRVDLWPHRSEGAHESRPGR